MNQIPVSSFRPPFPLHTLLLSSSTTPHLPQTHHRPPAFLPQMTVKHCETCHRPYHQSRSCLQQLVPTTVILLALVGILGVGTLKQVVTHLEKLITIGTQRQHSQHQWQPPPKQNNSACPFPIVYNKPPKTASTRIQIDLFEWAHAQNRSAYKCSPFIQQANIQMRECVPTDHSGCAIIATHVVMSPTMTKILERKIGHFVLMTSTRRPRDRLLSLYLQERRLKGDNNIDMSDLERWLLQYNPWNLYNYHMGGNIYRACPLTDADKLLIPDLVNKADIVIDADLHNVSAAILKWKRLFQLKSEKANVRSASDLHLDHHVEQLINNASCVEDEMHRLYRLRMASLYQQATGESCLSDTRDPTPCF